MLALSARVQKVILVCLRQFLLSEKRGEIKLECLIYSGFQLSLSERRKREKDHLIQNYRSK